MIDRKSLISTTEENKKPSINIEEVREEYALEILELCYLEAQKGENIYVAMEMESIKTGMCIDILCEKHNLTVEAHGNTHFIRWDKEENTTTETMQLSEKETRNATT